MTEECKDGLSIDQGEPNTMAWFAIRLGPSTFVYLMHFIMIVSTLTMNFRMIICILPNNLLNKSVF